MLKMADHHRNARAPVAPPQAMHVASVNLYVRNQTRAEALSAIDELIRRTRAWPGCLKCRLLTDADDMTALTLVSEWDTRQALDGFLASREFLILKGMRILLREDPEAVLDEVVARARLRLGRSDWQ
jgi:quinol monooxygenase YgiN